MTDYNDGKWHGWNGGECPVHPKSVVEYQMRDERATNAAIDLRWNKEGFSGDIVAFRVVTPYVEPQTYTGKCWASQADIGSAAIFYKTNFSETAVFGTWTAEHVSGKLRRFSWEADA